MTWIKGQSGNPGGRHKKWDLPALCREHTLEAIGVLVQCLRDDDSRVAVAAARELLDRGHGKAPLTVAGTEGQNITILHLVAAREVAEAIERQQPPKQIEAKPEPTDLTQPAQE